MSIVPSTLQIPELASLPGKSLGASASIAQGLPTFFIIGPPRTGTTWMHGVLREYACLPNPTKETRFFDRYFDRGLAWYVSHYRKSNAEYKTGEIAPTYFASSQARERIARLIPQAKIVCTFRNPVDRVWSLYRLKRAYGMIPWSFDQALVRDPELMESSRYASHLQEWRSAFGAAQVLVTFHEDMQADPQSYLDQVLDFIGVPRVTLLAEHKPRLQSSASMTEPRSYYWTRGATLLAEWSKARRLDPVVAAAKKWGALALFLGGGPAFVELSSAQRTRLRQLFRPEVESLEAMLNRDFASWK